MEKIKIGIVGGAGYTGGELLRILVNHPSSNIVFVHSKSSANKYIYQVHTDLLGDTDLKFTDTMSQEIDLLFMCVAHGEAKKFLSEHVIDDAVRIIDLSQDFRITGNHIYGSKEFIYGLPELNRNQIMKANYIANPGCFATCLQLALLPVASNLLLKSEIHISATTGSTGAGQSLSPTAHYSWRSNNLSSYKAFEHQHLAEVNQSITQLQESYQKDINFIPHRGSFTRGIFASCYIESTINLDDAIAMYQEFYAEHPFVFVSKDNIDLKQVVNTNKCLLYIEKHGDKLLITSIIDNLLKGASGQAVQNMNLMFGMEETLGLKLKPVAF